ncbi:hypothetical protein [Pararhizobium sp.]|uniref:hypothetical protein n=1 Tax=Pararhizobium sp. TaxID=1977563 RepID=UPI0027214CAD|nr:hypothetical protein [Pararhizobium sp.]MDO9415328.1 hypothetical protein [Pararhizobium sp.]
MAFAIKIAIDDPDADQFSFDTVKTMYGGKAVAKGDLVFVFASENEGGQGLIASAIVLSAEAIPRRPDFARQTPCVSLRLERIARAKRPLGRNALKTFRDWDDGQPETELNFKLYRQATNKLIGLSDETATFLERHF